MSSVNNNNTGTWSKAISQVFHFPKMLAGILQINLQKNHAMRGPYYKNNQFNICIAPLVHIREICSIYYFQQLALDLQLIVGQASLQLTPATSAYSRAITTNMLLFITRISC